MSFDLRELDRHDVRELMKLCRARVVYADEVHNLKDSVKFYLLAQKLEKLLDERL